MFYIACTVGVLISTVIIKSKKRVRLIATDSTQFFSSYIVNYAVLHLQKVAGAQAKQIQSLYSSCCMLVPVRYVMLHH